MRINTIKNLFLLLILSTTLSSLFSMSVKSMGAIEPAGIGNEQYPLKLEDIWIRDPNIIFFNGMYYMTGTTASDGFLGYSSPDLVNWQAHGHIYTRNASSTWALRDFWAPEMVHRDGKFYLFFSAKTDATKRGTGVAVSNNPMGPYVDLMADPLTLPAWECLDGHLFSDIGGSGKEYLIFVHEWVELEFGEMWIQEINENYTQLVGSPVYLFKGSDAPWSNKVVDGPSMLRYNGIYYLFWSSFSNGYGCGYAESHDLLGNYTQSVTRVISKDGGHSTYFRLNGTGDLMITFHRPNGGGMERAEVKKLIYRKNRWFIDIGPCIHPIFFVFPLAFVSLGCYMFLKKVGVNSRGNCLKYAGFSLKHSGQ
ncbi:MAG: family 43 glycosylhydrolase [Promethearchaeota archaeon]